MDLERSPLSSPYSSQPDLSQPQEADLKDSKPKASSLRKRKQPDLDVSITKALDAFMGKMQQTLDDFRADVKSDLNTLRSDYMEIKGSLAATNTKQNELIATVSQVCASLDFSSDRQDKLEKRVEITEKYINTQKKDATSISDMKNNILDLQSQLNEYQQRERINNLEITGLPERDKENLMDIVVALARVCEVM